MSDPSATSGHTVNEALPPGGESGPCHVVADVVVVGGGGAGLAAAVRSAELGASVILLEKNADLGGTTALSIGSMSANQTRLQVRSGVIDSADDHFEDMGKFAGALVERDNLDLRRLYVENSAEALHWVMDHGVALFGPMPEPPHRVPRMHNVLPNSRAYIYWLSRAARKAGVRIVTDAHVVSLEQQGQRIIGVRYRDKDGIETLVEASEGVVLAAGDFSSSEEIKGDQFTSEKAVRVPGINSSSTGDGLRLGLEVGGRILNGDLAVGPEMRFVPPPRKLLLQKLPPWKVLSWIMLAALRWLPDAIQRPFIMSFATSYLAPARHVFERGGILVNSNGDRFCNELEHPELDLPGQPGGEAYIVLDHATAKNFDAWPNYISTAPGVAYAYLPDYRRNRKDIFHRADSIDELAAQVGFDPQKLSKSCGNAMADGPLVALGPVKSWIVLTEGGLAIDTDLRVLDDHDRPIEGLYAAGSNGQGGLLLEGHGNHVGWAMISGRLVAASVRRNAAARVRPQGPLGGAGTSFM